MSLAPSTVKQQQSVGAITDVAIVDISTVAGQATMANSFPVVIASDQTDVPIEVDGNTVTQTPTITAALYAAGQCLGDMLTFVNVVSGAGAGGVLKTVTILDQDAQDAITELWLFNQTIATPLADQAPWVMTAADAVNLICVVSTLDGTWYDGGGINFCDIEVSKRLDLVGTSLFGRLVTRGTPTPTAANHITSISQKLVPTTARGSPGPLPKVRSK